MSFDNELDYYRLKYHKLSTKILARSKYFRDFRPSVIYASENSKTSPDLLILALESIKYANENLIQGVDTKIKDSLFFNIFPGEHYRLLKGFVNAINPMTIVEIGTLSGMSALAMSQSLQSGIIYTFDIVPYESFETHLNDMLMQSKIKQIICDLSDQTAFETHIDILNKAEVIFMDGPKDGAFEYQFIEKLTQLKKMGRRFLLIDDIRFVNMIDLWDSIKSPKLDLTSFGHWCGTGLVDISAGLKLRS